MSRTDQTTGIILAAGFGTRMKPLTEALPKPLLPFLNTPIIAYTVDHMIRAGIRHIGVNLHHHGHLIPPVLERLAVALKPSVGDISFTFVEETDIRGTAGGIAGVWRAMGSPRGTTIAINGDALMSLDLASALATHKKSGASATILTRHVDGDHPGGVWATPEGQITGLRKAGDLQGTELDFMGVHILEASTLDRVSSAAETTQIACMMNEVYIPALGSAAVPHAITNDDFWIALDNPGLLLQATRQVLDDPAIFPQAPLFDTHGRGLTLMNPARINDKALLSAPIFAGAMTSIAAGARVGTHAVLDGVEVASGTRVENAVLFGMGQVEGEWSGCVAVNGHIAQVVG